MTTRPAARRTTRTLAPTVAGWLLVLTGSGHTALVVVGTGTPTASESHAHETMAATSVVIGGLERSYWELFQGFSLMMALMVVGLGALLLLVLRRAPQLVLESRGLLLLVGAVLLPALLISVVLLPPPPIVLLGIATVAVLAALLSPGRAAPTPQCGTIAA